jgi:17beta-estradiol 17-dehydrogenase / very-long-chain 3-oxoacyl-CoA reductase
MNRLFLLAFIVGLFYLIRYSLKLVFTLKKIFWGKEFKPDSSQSWAAITGCTDGMGKEFALELARKGFNMLLISRNPNKLSHVAQEIKKINPYLLTRVIVVDFSSDLTQEFYKTVMQKMEDLNI